MRETPWWVGDGLGVGPLGLTLDGHDVAAAAATHGTPLYLYSRSVAVQRLRALQDALASTGAPSAVYYALKANRYPPLVAALREAGAGLDACSPREVEWALTRGFTRDRISVTAGMLSERDLDQLVASGCHLNLDGFSALRRYASRVPAGTRVGLRIDAEVEVGYGKDPKVTYGNSKFGLRSADVPEALALARRSGLSVDTLHMHCGWGLQEDDEAEVDAAFAGLARLARLVPELETINVGGGLGVRQRGSDRPLPLGRWAELLRRHFAPLGVSIACEPGTWVVAVAGLLVAQVTTVEQKGAIRWLGVDAGHNVNVYPGHYAIPLEIVPVARPLAPPDTTYHVAGNLNEAGDVFARARTLPALEEGDLVAFLPTGAYGASMASDHCLRGWATEAMVG
jgi:diaminopimelate decarboxylase